uniref:Uncharacterized protein n=1 Tax=Pyrodinium bahamense TaxID=73915 RepID=A0A7S0A855_9DINO
MDSDALIADQTTLAKVIGKWRAVGMPCYYTIDDGAAVRSDPQGQQGILLIKGEDIVLEFIHLNPHPRWKLDLARSTAESLFWIGPHYFKWTRVYEQRWNDFIVLLSHVAEQRGVRLSASTISGKAVTSVHISDPMDTTWAEARQMMGKGLQPYLARSRVRFVSPSGVNLTLQHDDKTMASILGLLAPSPPQTPEIDV